MNTAVIAAAGRGRRFDSDTPKQFLPLLGKPVIFHTLERFENCDAVDEMILVLATNEIPGFAAMASYWRFAKLVQVVGGGTTRAESVFNGLQAVKPATEIVAVHDGVRPLVSDEEITRTIKRAAESGAACLTAPVTDTIKQVKMDEITGTLDRANLRRALTPQAFRRDILTSAFENADLSDAVTDECFLVEKFGVRISVVEGSARNIKITHSDDIAIAEMYLKNSF